MIRAGLCSITFRALSADEVIDVAAGAGLESIEWGVGDRGHLTPGDVTTARRVGERTREAGLVVASLGSYFRCHPGDDVTPLLDSAEAMGAPRIRVWAGEKGSADTTGDERAGIVSALTDAATRAADRGVELALEYHGRTLTDTPESARRLMEETAHDNVSSYWQPTQGADDETALAELDIMAPWVSTVHVFSWWPVAERLRLHDREALWTRAFERVAALPRVTDALLEFVPRDDPALLREEAETLRSWLHVAAASD
ncbi:Sugar phosphate isomerase/epimerase [Paramicrobacterium humi]|uniref:Sugar phosphate isomerase/epimerase n=1 Tax=Paramicrobacterium humi TaxID=640635 RepID=A0A1H4J685_9MICO|nr:TIM barrel protein [Microbacterium humi]SEB41727.1 Sugar phosphate isomerase/epimerase [Microbacterium humi]